jgi:hypothetical protein
MANTQAVSTSFKVEVMNGIHAMSTTVVRAGTTADTWKAALFLASGSQGAAITAYAVTNEVSGSGYSAGGIAFTWTAPSSTGTTAFTTPSASLAFGTVTLSTSFDAVTLYNSTQSNKAMGTYTFGATTVTAGTFTLTMPTNDSSTGLFRIA